MNCCKDIAQLEGGWPERVLTMQRNWIGRSEGAEVDFPIDGYGPVRVFTTRIDTIYGATCMILAPEHPISCTKLPAELRARRSRWSTPAPRRAPAMLKRKASTPASSPSTPFSGERVPVWVGNFVLMGYGTGAIMAVPAHDQRDFEFCRNTASRSGP